jgi:hypothetical protein
MSGRAVEYGLARARASRGFKCNGLVSTTMISMSDVGSFPERSTVLFRIR